MTKIIAYSVSYVGIKRCESEFYVDIFNYVEYFRTNRWIHHVEVYTAWGIKIIRRDEL